MARLPVATRESVPEGQKEVFDEMVQKLGGVPSYGPGSLMIHVPQVHKLATALNDYLRNESSLPKKIQELSMLVTAREMDCQHIWNAHAGSAREAGVPGNLVDSLRESENSPVLRRTKRPWSIWAENCSALTKSAEARFRPHWSSSVRPVLWNLR